MNYKYLTFVLSLFLILNVIILFCVNNVLLYISFLLVLAPIVTLMLLVSKHSCLYFDVSLITFYLFFFIVAPVTQIKAGSLPNTFPISNDSIVIANIYLSLFICAYLFFRFTMFPIKEKESVPKEFKLLNDKLILIILLGLFLIVVIPDLTNLLNSIIYRENLAASAGKSETLIQTKYFYSIPIFLVAYWWYKNRDKLNFVNVIILLIFIALLLLVKNPFVEKRNGLGPIYLSLLFFMYYKRITPQRYMYYLIITLLILFPLSSTITHSDFGLIEVMSGTISFASFFTDESFLEAFNTLHYDAWSNFMATIDYVKHYGVTYGAQLAGSLLFFVPRSIWGNKPISTGEMIGDYLSDHYAMWFSNLSNPLPAEGYVNFGFFGLILFAFFLALISRGVKILFLRGSFYGFIAWYITIHFIFLLRGDLMNGYSFLAGVLLAIWVSPMLLNNVTILTIKQPPSKMPKN